MITKFPLFLVLRTGVVAAKFVYRVNFGYFIVSTLMSLSFMITHVFNYLYSNFRLWLMIVTFWATLLLFTV